MKRTTILALAAVLIMVPMLSACSGANSTSSTVPGSNSEPAPVSVPTPTTAPTPTPQPVGQIYLYGEQHGVEKILDKELELWGKYYKGEGMRHLFIEMPYYTAEFLNLWMQSDNNDILDAIYADWEGSASYNPFVKEFYKKIKLLYPETVFHGTDVGHQYYSTGKRYLQHLKDNGLESSEQYTLTQEAIEQGKYFYDNSDDVYRENKMTENLIREFDKLNGDSVMGIYGSAHTNFEAMNYGTHSVPCMANQLKKIYGDNIHAEDISGFAKDIDPVRVDTIKVGGKDYTASYFGKEDLSSFSSDFVSREFWRLENAYDDFKDNPKTGDVLPYNNFPMTVDKGQVFIIDIIKTDGSLLRIYGRSDGNQWQGMPTTEAFEVE